MPGPGNISSDPYAYERRLLAEAITQAQPITGHRYQIDPRELASLSRETIETLTRAIRDLKEQVGHERSKAKRFGLPGLPH